MAFIIETINPFDPLHSHKLRIDEPITVREWVAHHYPETGEFPVPTICLFNGQPLLRAGWDRVIQQKDIVNFVAVPAFPIVIVVMLVLVVAFTVYSILTAPKTPGQPPGSDPVFSTKGQQNEIRLGEPVECSYGRNRIYPSMASRPYYEYRNNDQFQFSLFCLGQGFYDIEAIQIEDTPIANFQEVQWEVVPPGSKVTLFPAAVYTSVEAGGQVLYAPNQPEYSGDGFVGPFPANPAGTEATRISIDLVLPKGLNRMTKAGKPDIAGVRVEVKFRLIDNVGAPLGPWVDFTPDPYIEIDGYTTTPQRKTYSRDVDLGRYELKMRRISNAGLTSAFSDEVDWDGLRSYLNKEQDFGNKTLIASIIRATNNLNNQTQSRFNVICTRKLPIRESGGEWSEPIATRSIVWAFVDTFKSVYGGRIFDDQFFDWAALEDLDALYASRGDNFDWIFRDPITVWEGAQTIARVGRATPLISGSLITMKRDGPLEVPVALFNQENIVSESFELDIVFWELDEYDSVRVEYTEPSTGYKQETVLCTLPGGTSDHPEDVRFAGIQDRTHAYHEGLFYLAWNRYRRQNAIFDTGLEGYIPTFGDLIAVAHDVPKWGLGGYIVDAGRSGGDLYQLWLSQPVEFKEGVDYQICLRGRQSQVLGPFDVTATEDPSQVLIRASEDIDFLLGGSNEPMIFVFGVANQVTQYLRVLKLEPQGEEAIRVTAVIDNPIVHSFDDLVPPPLGENLLAPVPPDLPTIAWLKVSQIDSVLHIIQATWAAAFGAQYYIAQTSEDGEHWHERSQTSRTSIQVQAFPGDLYIRVAGVNNGQGPWIQSHIEVGYLVLSISGAWDDLEWAVSWQEVIGAVSYTVEVFDNSASMPVSKRIVSVTALTYSYDYSDASFDSNVEREMRVEITPVFPPEAPPADTILGPITPEGIDLHNSIPLAAYHLQYTLTSVESDSILYHLFWAVPAEDDLIRVKVWLSPVNGFDAGIDIPVMDETASSPGHTLVAFATDVSIPLESGGGHPAYYWRVALFDVWGNELTTNLSDQAAIPAYP